MGKGSMLDFAIDVVEQAGRVLLGYQSSGLSTEQVRTKVSLADLVTEADVSSERLILGAIRTQFPAHAIFSEESSSGEPPDVEWLWLVDPLDGTTNFAHRLPIFAVNLALAHRGEIVLGVTHDPTIDRTYWAEMGNGAWLRIGGHDHPLHVSNARSLKHCLLATGFPYDRATNPDDNVAEFAALDRRCQAVRRLGSSALAAAWVAAGILDGYWEAGVKPWDTGAGSLLVREAGGAVSDYRGNPWQLVSRNILVSNGQDGVHPVILETISGARRLLEEAWKKSA
jgi:myo-inositol-1(or 4)-monophosphatase